MHEVGERDAVASAGAKRVTVDGTAVAVFAVDGTFHAIANECPHQGGPLCEGRVEDGSVFCPWHGYEFDIETGEQPLTELSVETYEVVVRDGTVYVAD